MGFRDSLATQLLMTARTIGERLGCNLAVTVEGNKLKTRMEPPDTDKRAWDSRFYERSGLFVKGYANPVKPVVRENPDAKKPDNLDVESAGGTGTDNEVWDVIPSYRYQQHQDQHVVSELVNPTEQWQLILYGLLGLGVLMFVNIIVVMYATGGI